MSCLMLTFTLLYQPRELQGKEITLLYEPRELQGRTFTLLYQTRELQGKKKILCYTNPGSYREKHSLCYINPGSYRETKKFTLLYQPWEPHGATWSHRGGGGMLRDIIVQNSAAVSSMRLNAMRCDAFAPCHALCSHTTPGFVCDFTLNMFQCREHTASRCGAVDYRGINHISR